MSEPLSPEALLHQACERSQFVAHAAERQADWLEGHSQELLAPPDFAVWQARIERAAKSSTDMTALKRALREQRMRLQMHIVSRHAGRLAVYDETAHACSVAADLFLQTAVRWIEAALDAEGRFGVPYGAASGRRQHLVVFALGKLGAGELNLSSDVDLILAYAEAGETDKGKTNQQYFVRVAQMLVDALDPITVDGFVYRVDLRLRPYGDSGPLVMHFDALEAYFETQGRDWERYAFIKARACAGDIAAGEEMLRALKPFTFRRYLDFGAIHSLRDMKARIVKERHDERNLKLGPGGIRDIEFAVQVLQMIWGGRQAELQESNLLLVLPALARLGHLNGFDADALARAYRFLRDAEHSVQALADEQTQELPQSATRQAAVAMMMGYASYEAFLEALAEHRQLALAFFSDAIAPVEAAEQKRGWDEHDAESLDTMGLGEAAECVRELAALAAARDRKSVGAEGRERLDALMPLVLEDLKDRPDARVILERLCPILRAVLRRSAYLVLLQENPRARALLVDLLARSQWLAERVRDAPMQLDVLLDDRSDSGLPGRQVLADELRIRIDSVRDQGEERLLDILREFRQQHAFAVALLELRGLLPLMKVSDYYTHLAEVLLEQALDIAWRECNGPASRPFVIVGYGKLGGIELGPSSDLDLVFIHGFEDERSQFLHRLARRLLHVLTARTYHGALYEIDMRLRPSGNAGTMISSLEAFHAYHQKQAWTWELQALVRARVVAGDQSLAERFEALRRQLICQRRDVAELKSAVMTMRARMAAHHGDDADLKQGSGGIVDIEFMVQYLVLAHAHTHPSLVEFSDNVRILQAAGASGVLEAQTAEALTEAYLALRKEAHRLALDLPNPDRAKAVLEQHRQTVRGAWDNLFG